MGVKKTKQGLLPIEGFFKHPSASTLKKHKSLQKKLVPKPTTMKKPRVDKRKQERLAEEKLLLKGAEGWKQFLQHSGVQEVERFRTDILFLVHGDAPNPGSEEGLQLTASDLDVGSDEENESY
jgi:hypothetical protein